MALAVEGDVVLEALGLGVLRVRTHAIERAVEVIRNVAIHFAVIESVF